MRSSPCRLALRLALLLSLPAVSACGGRASLPPPNISVSAVDASEASLTKPVPTAAIVTDDAAAAAYSASVEVWGERVSRAWGRVCRSLAAQGVAVSCPAPLPTP